MCVKVWLAAMILMAGEAGTGSADIFEIRRFEQLPSALVVHRDLFVPPQSHGHDPAQPPPEEARTPARMGEEGTNGGDRSLEDGLVVTRRISYEGYTFKGGQYYFLIRVDGEYFIGRVEDTIAGNARILRGDSRQITLEIEGEEVDIKIRDLVQ